MVDDEQRGQPETPLDATILGQLSEEQIHALASPQARTTLRYLAERGPATLTELADVVTGTEAAATGSIAGPSRREDVLIALHHRMLPRLAACGFLRYEPDQRAVTDVTIPPTVATLLEGTD